MLPRAMANTVAVVETAVSFRRGVEAALQRAGFDSVEADAAPSAVLITLRPPEACSEIERQAASGATVVVLLPEPTAAEHAHALSHGATGTVDWSADPEEIVAVLRVALEGQARIPVAIARELASEWPGAHAPRPEFSEEEIEWITDLARGTPVARLADDSGYSERAMFRRLHDIYTRLGATNRAEAIVAAERLGLLSA
jgi:DNA-binding NarL/FixJ family response regulator